MRRSRPRMSMASREVVAGEDVQGAAGEHLAHRVEAVAVERGVAYPQGRDGHLRLPWTRGPVRADPRRPVRCPASGRRRGRPPVRRAAAVGPLGDQKTEVEGGTGDALGCLFGPVRPHLTLGPTSSTRNSVAGGVSPRTWKAKSRARTPMRATWRRRSVECASRPARPPRPGRGPRSPSSGRWPWRRPTWAARTRGSGCRRGPRGGPLPAPVRPARQSPSSAAGGSPAPSAPSSTNPPGEAIAFSTNVAKASASVTASRAERSVQARWAIW